MTRFVVCGEALIDLAPASDAADTFSSTWHAQSAGGPMNTAVALGRLGADVHFLGRLSRDSFGAQLRGHIQKSNVALDLSIESSQSTSIAVVSLDSAGVASYTFHFAGTANFDWQPEDLPVLDADDWLHIASLACVVRPGSEVLLDWTQTCRAGMSYDINVRPTVITDPKSYWEEVQPWLRVVGQHRGVVKASDADVAFLAKSDGDDAEPVDVLAGWVEQYGLQIGVLTLGAGGALAVDPDGRRTAVPGFPAKVVDTVGAGDTFMAGFLDGYLGRGQDVEASLARGAAAASIVCSRHGADPPTVPEVESVLTSRS
jgi:fructokinase